MAKKKLKADQQYRENQRDAQKKWRTKNPHYYKGYRQNHVEYTQRNRELQKQRRSKQQAAIGVQHANVEPVESVAKMDLAPMQPLVQQGKYVIFRVDGSASVAKMDLAQGQVVEIMIVRQT